jgi:VWFA-related protein
MSRGRAFAIVCGSLLLSSALFLAQEDQFRLRARVDEVRVPVSVRDENGALVGGLTKGDFTVLEDGKAQMIADFSTDPQPLSAAIMVDTAITGDQLRRFCLMAPTLMQQFKATDEFAGYRFDHVVTKMSDFTSNPQNLEKGFDAVKDIADSKPPDELGAGLAAGPSPLRWILDRTQIGTNGAPSDPRRPSPNPAPTTNKKAPDSVSRVLHDAMYMAVADLEKRPPNRRKVIILISNGVVSGTNEHPQGDVNARLYRDGIQIFAIDPEHKIFDHMNLLNSYTHGTGGVVFDGASEQAMDRGLKQAVEQAREQYVIGYVSTNELSGDRPVLRKIDIKLKDRKGLKIVHRQNYLQYP